MKPLWHYAALSLCVLAAPALADDNRPTDDTIKQQFTQQSARQMRIDALKLKPLESLGNQATWMVEGDMFSNQDLHAIVGMAGNYLFYQRTWTKDKPVKFSAMMTSVGTPASGWKTEFFSMQTAASNAGRPFEKNEDLSKVLVVNGSDFREKFAAIDATFANAKVKAEKQQSELETVNKKLDELEERVRQAWGKDANGKQLDRSAVQQAMLEKMYAEDKNNYPLDFENKYMKNRV